jgi:hypothetical protein
VEFVFQWGTAANALTNTTFATPPSGTGTAVIDVSATLSGLAPHTKYFYRVAAAGDHGLGLGTVQSFTTVNRPPVGMNDTFVALPGAPITMNVLLNDSDPDADVVSIKSFTQPPSAAGRISKVGQNLVFTPGSGFATFVGPVAFTYVLQDSLGLVAAAAVSASITQDTMSINPATNAAVLAVATSYTVSVDTGEANTPWRAVETSPFVTLSAPSGSGDGAIQVNVTANLSKNPRTATVLIGGQLHTMTQAGVVAPVLTAPVTVPPAIVSGTFTMPIHTYLPAPKYSAKGLPSGLSVVVNPSTGEASVQGIPNKAGIYPVTIRASNAASNTGNAAASTIAFQIDVQALPTHMVGQHVALVQDNPNFNENRGAVIQFDVLNTGSISGSVRLGLATTAPETAAFKARLLAVPSTPGDPTPPATAQITINRKAPLNPLLLSMTFGTATTLQEDRISGTIEVATEAGSSTAAVGWRNKWSATVPATVQQVSGKPVREIFNTYIEVPGGETGADALPQGDGLVTFTVEPNGTVAWTAAMPDGITLTGKVPLSPSNDFFVWNPMYKRGVLDYVGRMVGTLAITRPEDTVAGTLTWSKAIQMAPGVAPTYNYLDGFNTTRVITGARHQVPTGTVFALLNQVGNAQLNFLYGGSAAAAQATQLSQNFTINPNNTTTFTAATNPAQVKLSINKTLGTFTGSFSLVDNVVRRSNIAIRGVLINAHLGTGFGRGFFVLPQLPTSGTSTAQTPRLSGQLQLLPD